MPLYALQCPFCAVTGDQWLEADATPPPCPHCHIPLRKRITVPGIAFRGPGFYTTDHR